MTENPTPPALDVEAIVTEIRARAAHARQSGGYRPEILDIPFEHLAPESTLIRLRPEMGYSSKPVVGPAITTAKKTLLRGIRHVLDDAFTQTNTAVASLREEIAENDDDVARLDRRIDEIATRVTELSVVVRDIAALVERLAPTDEPSGPTEPGSSAPAAE